MITGTQNKDVQLLTQNIVNGRILDLAELVESIGYTTDINKQPGTLTFSIVKTNEWVPNEGDIVRLIYKGVKIFYGKIFTKKITGNGHWNVTCYDSMRYLQNTDTLALPPMTTGQLMLRLARLAEIPRALVVNDSGWLCPAIIHDGKSYFDMLDDALGKTIINTGNWFILRDNFGTLEHVSILSLLTNIVIGEESFLTDYDFSSTIDESYTVVKATRDNQETGKRDVWMTYDSTRKQWWGKLQFHTSLNENYNDAQAIAFVNNALRSLREKQKTLRLNAVGIPGLSAGMGIYIRINDLASEGFDKLVPVFITKCDHKIDPFHSMTLEVKVV